VATEEIWLLPFDLQQSMSIDEELVDVD